ncbi:MAG: isoprenyl transferase [Acetivibrionales bacterium]
MRKKKKAAAKVQEKLPVHIAIIMDGNRRWAERRGLPRSVGHREGANTLKRIVKECDALGIKYLTAFAFSTENWNRPKEEVDALMSLLLEFLRNADKELAGKNIRISVIGETDRLSEEIRREIARVMQNTAENTGLNLIIALNYGSRTEIARAAARIATDVKEGRIRAEDINEEMFSGYLYTAGIPDPDLVIRPSGENRLSNFLLWQSSYSEFWYSDILWPDFTKKNLLEAIEAYQQRDRRFGGL